MYLKREIEDSIYKATAYIFDCQNADGGIKFEDENSNKSGVWVTAEALEFILKSKILPVTVYERVQPMIDFLLNSQNKNGSWDVLTDNNESSLGSTIATGHCTYALKLALSGGFNSKSITFSILNAIKRGEDWLRGECIVREGVAFWGATKKKANINPDVNERSRMEHIFTTFYAVMGLINPDRYKEDSDFDELLITKTYHFFIEEAKWFVQKYTSKSKFDGLQPVDFAKVSSSICRIVNAFSLVGKEMPVEIHEGLSGVLKLCASNPFMISSISINTDNIQQFATSYNNNTPFDMGMALINIDTSDSNLLQSIISEYLTQQQTEGYWYLGFSEACIIKTWSTSEALIVLETAYFKYEELFREEIETKYKNQATCLADQVNQIKRFTLVAAIVSILLSIVVITGLICLSQIIADSHPVLSNIMLVLLIPILINIVYDITKSIKFHSH